MLFSPRLRLSVAEGTSSHHELTAVASEDNGSDGEQLILDRLRSILGLSDPENR